MWTWISQKISYIFFFGRWRNLSPIFLIHTKLLYLLLHLFCRLLRFCFWLPCLALHSMLMLTSLLSTFKFMVIGNFFDHCYCTKLLFLFFDFFISFLFLHTIRLDVSYCVSLLTSNDLRSSSIKRFAAICTPLKTLHCIEEKPEKKRNVLMASSVLQ